MQLFLRRSRFLIAAFSVLSFLGLILFECMTSRQSEAAGESNKLSTDETGSARNHHELASSSVSPGKYAIQLGAFKCQENAEKMLNMLLEKGYRAYLSERSAKGQTLYRVRYGGFKTEEEARKYNRLLTEEVGTRGIVVLKQPKKDTRQAERLSSITPNSGTGGGSKPEKAGMDCTHTDRWFLRHGDVVVFYGDSITDDGRYCRFVERAVRSEIRRCGLEFDVLFYTMGFGGKTADWGLKNIEKVLTMKPTVVTMMWGMNDQAGLSYVDKERLAEFYSALSGQVLLLKRSGIRPVIIGVTPVNDAMQVGRSSRVCGAYFRAQRKVALIDGAWFVDTQRLFQRLIDKSIRCGGRLEDVIPDGFHPNAHGHWAIAKAILDAWNIPTEDWNGGRPVVSKIEGQPPSIPPEKGFISD